MVGKFCPPFSITLDQCAHELIGTFSVNSFRKVQTLFGENKLMIHNRVIRESFGKSRYSMLKDMYTKSEFRVSRCISEMCMNAFAHRIE